MPISATITGASGPFASGTWTQVDVTSLVTGDGVISLALTAINTVNTSLASRESSNYPYVTVETDATPMPTMTPTPSPPTTFEDADPVIAAAGDIVCGQDSQSSACRQIETSDLLVQLDPDAVLALGDMQYELGQYENFVDFYDPSWGRVKDKTFPAVGNHEYGTSGTSKPECEGETYVYACGYFDYFNGDGNITGRAGDRDKGYYAFDLGSWRIYAVNSNCRRTGAPSCEIDSAQEEWLRLDLAAHPRSCQLIYMHHPLWTSDTRDFDTTELLPIFQTFYEAGGDVALVGHSHFYERFAPQDPGGNVDAMQGIRQFVVGTGGRNVYGFGDIEANSEVRNGDTFGVIRMTLHPDVFRCRYRCMSRPASRRRFADRAIEPGSDSHCWKQGRSNLGCKH